MLARETGLCVRILQTLARAPSEWTSIAELADALALTRPYAAKLVRALRNSGFLLAKLGVTGGVQIDPRKREATLLDVAKALDDPFVAPHCMMLRDRCDADAPCPMHKQWVVIHKRMLEAFKECPATLADGARRAQSGAGREPTTPPFPAADSADEA